MKKIYSLFAAVVLAASVNAQTTVNYVMADQGWANATAISGGTIDANLSFKTSKNGSSNAPAYFTADKSLRFYFLASGDGGGINLTPKNGAKITNVTINAVTGNTPKVSYKVDGGTKVNATLAGTTYTISGVEAATSLSFQNANTTNTQLRIVSISVTYSLPTMAVGDINSAKVNFIKNTVVENSILFAAKADVQIVNMNGQVVKTASVNENTSLNVASLPKGTYIVTATIDGKTVSQKIMKK